MTFENTPNLGWEYLKNNTVIHAWNKHDSYYFDADNGIQLTNHYEEYWTRNVMMLGYYTGTTWNLIYRNDELTGFTKIFEGITDDYMELTLWKDLSYGGYNFRLAIRYHLGINDQDLTITPYIKNLGIAIPYTLGFGWELKDIKINNIQENNQIQIDDTSYLLNQTLDNKYTNITQTQGVTGIHNGSDSSSILTDTNANWVVNELIGITINNLTDGSNGIITANTSTTITAILTDGVDNDWDTNDEYHFEYQVPSPVFQLYRLEGGSNRKLLYLKWDKDLDYIVWVKSRSGQYNAPVSLFIKVGTLGVGQEKYTEMHWLDQTTFGDTAFAGTSALGIESFIYGGYFQMGAIGGTGTSITAKLAIFTAEHKVKCALYNADKTLLANSVTEEKTVTVAAPTIITFNFGETKPTLVANAWYHIVVWSESTSGGASIYRVSSGGYGISYQNLAYGAFPNPWVPTLISAAYLENIYCTYTEAGGAVEAAKLGDIILDSSNALGNDVYIDTGILQIGEVRMKTRDY
ncbi:MAG: hypothetical protein IMZ59_02160 [Actinobacteria bacterium]|nr:hypothetical protein [Actinomycetota bacterium]